MAAIWASWARLHHLGLARRLEGWKRLERVGSRAELIADEAPLLARKGLQQEEEQQQ
jgi:hypothetical protein